MPDAKHILVVDDERDLVELLTYNLKKAGYQTSAAHSGRAGLELALRATPDLIVLDVMLPELSGTEIVTRLRANPGTATTPIILLTAKTEEIDQLVGLAVGADDYVTKPFSTKVLIARIDAMLRRTRKPSDAKGVLSLGPIEVHTDTHEAFVDGQPIKLTLTEFKILSSLLQAQGKVLSRSILMSKAMGPGVTVTERTIDVHVTSIRKKLNDHAPIVRTVRGVGYRATLEPEPGDVDASV
ncbi:MAG: response regulator transcription factor [Planctomycetota bacterium]|nr:response regulator transcription factor [Planctomycetota bacterium]